MNMILLLIGFVGLLAVGAPIVPARDYLLYCIGDFAFTGSLLVLSVYYVLFPVGCSCIYPDGKSGK